MLILSHFDRIESCTMTACVRLLSFSRSLIRQLSYYITCCVRLDAANRILVCDVIHCALYRNKQNGNKSEAKAMKRCGRASMNLAFSVIFAVIR